MHARATFAIIAVPLFCAFLYKIERDVYFTIIFRMLDVCSAVVPKLFKEKLSLQNKCGVDLNSNNDINKK